jgi:CheY-like chemotaxis protein
MPSSRPKVLVVDDNADLRESLAMLLQANGYAAELAADGCEALSKLREDPRFSLVLLDLRMPRMNGWELRQELLKDWRLSSIPVVIMSATEEMDAGPRAMKVACRLRKPVPIDALKRVLQRFCRRDI